MRIEFDISLTELGKAVEVLTAELKKLGLNIRVEQAYTIIGAIVSAFREAGKCKRCPGKGGGPD